MGWAKYQEDIVSRYWQDAKSVTRMQKKASAESGIQDAVQGGVPKPVQAHRKAAPDAQHGISNDPRADIKRSPSEPKPITAQAATAPTRTASKKGQETQVSKLREFTIAAARPLPVIVLADVSGSMSANGKIEALNDAIKAMVESFADEDRSRAEIHVAVVAFGKGGARLHQPLRPSAEIRWETVGAAGNTPMGAAFELVREMIEDPAQIPARAYRPSIVLISDGEPTDDWEEPLSRLLASERAAKATRFALGVGDDADPSMLAKFLADPSARVYSAHEGRQIKNFFRWVTMSVTQRTRSSNPNSVVAIDPMALDEYDF